MVGKNSSLRDLLRLPQGPVDLTSFDSGAAPGYPGKGKDDAPARSEMIGEKLSELQERLYANGRENPDFPRVLVILQGMDTSGKGGVIRHAIGMVDPQGIDLKAFKQPTEEERKHHFLWRIKKALPGPGMIGIFDRSQYEDVLVVRVEDLVPQEEWEKRYDQINKFEADLAGSGVKIIKCFLHVGHEEQKGRLLERLQNPEKYWKYNPGDVDARKKWGDYREAYEVLLEQCNTDEAPWYVVPADRKWYRNWAVAQLLLETLEEMDLSWPAADFDVAKEIERVNKS
ncbi:PPK2 family polyphosphate kinase [Luteococcus sp. OSA5]|uniref:PPK2 family polyphosphate kinase n=1 Tax=Luteococcus sp. OSA5 TaxID=3401630 RepID=UPI003B4319F7